MDKASLVEGMTESDYLHLGSLMKEMVETPAWVEYEKILERFVEARKAIILKPLHELEMPSNRGAEGFPEVPRTTDSQSRILAMETIKGAIIAFGVAKSLPHSIISAASDIRREKEKREDAGRTDTE